jgi:phage/plasmid-associated DNA primase
MPEIGDTPIADISAKRMYELFKEWCVEEGYTRFIPTNAKFGKAVAASGFITKKRKKTGHHFVITPYVEP